MQKLKRPAAVISVIHILFSMIYELAVSGIMEYPFEIMEPVRMGFIDIKAERIIFFLVSKLAGCILIYMIWYVLCDIVLRKRKMLAVLLAAAAVFALIIYPYNYLMEEDNLILYVESICYYPDYWQSYLTGVFYNACLMVFRHSLALPVIQNCLFVGGIWYLSEKVKERWGKRTAWVPYLLLLFPESFEIGLNPYRNDIYAVFCIWFFTFLFFVWPRDRKPSWQNKIGILALAALLVIWRGEGVVLVLIVLCLCLFVWELLPVQKVMWLGIFAVFCIVLALPQKIGDYKYYGNDYQMLNYMEVLQEILNDPESDLQYAGAKEDLEGIEKAVPVQTIKEAGMMGYRVYNWQTKNTVNQSLLSTEEQKCFISSANGIIIHNFDNYLQNRIRCFGEANGISERSYNFGAENFTDEQRLKNFSAGLQSIYQMSYEKYSVGLTVIAASKGGVFWYQTPFHNIVYQMIEKITEKALKFYQNIGFSFFLRFMAIVLMIAMEGYLIKLGGIRENPVNHITTLAVLGLWLGIFLFSPEGRSAYYYPVYDATLNFELVKERKNNR